ncbi:rod shape-determining protein MreD [Phnomibacter ginsenosidimutans]|uniref:Rod shape-determining protein MreD n=1 Tax=Phnomibacter ginsenosidimutans TaxID=2676868 RepID=A0A6I6GA69_9BACT|nr:rod shape-determining protein MreD [Phnomibacter ginsenosidimutans]QGW29557.1 rod shape-determining protein MreD [Phnomibacter ginsenosidimutans]
MSEPVKQIIRFILLVLVQALVLNHMPALHRFVTPYLYFLFLIWLPFNVSRPWMLILGFITGFALDLFTKTPGLHASACLWLAYMRTPLLKLLLPGETKELKTGSSPSVRSMGLTTYILFVVMLTLFHHVWLVMLEWMSFGTFLYFLGKVLFTTLASLLLILIAELLFRPIRKRRKD